MTPPFLLLTLLVAQEPPTPSGWGLADLIATLGVSGVFVFLFFDATKERRLAQKQLGDLLERIIPVLTLSTSTLKDVQEAMKATRPDPAVTDLHEEIAALRSELRSQRRE